jgi:hypothetical protein
MRTILIATVALGAAALASIAPVQAQVTIRAPGVAIDAGQRPYWQEHHEAEWRERRDFREAQFQRREWLRDHCVREWDGREICRR